MCWEKRFDMKRATKYQHALKVLQFFNNNDDH